MRSIADYTERILDDRQLPPGVLIANAHRRAAERGSTRPGADATVTRVVDDLIATGDFDELLVGAVDPAAWAVREALRDRATQRLSELAVHPGGETSALIADHLALEIDARYPALSDDFQRVLERFERDWGYRRSYATDLALPGCARDRRPSGRSSGSPGGPQPASTAERPPRSAPVPTAARTASPTTSR
ncbi:hypothetical protein ACTU3I_08310 [Microbacterium sp. RD1]|uniref:hypothetical protein n=1 Tax=Microbacterium sp. RD1 TaxID=3457313 RepID=UPI003FA5C41B